VKALVIIMALASRAYGDAELDPCACSPNKPGFHRADALTGDWGGARKDLFEHGIKVTAAYAGEVFAAPGLDDDKLVNAGLASLALDVELDSLVNDKLGSLRVSGFGIHGKGLQLMDIYGVSNNVATDDVRLFEAYYDQPLGPFGIRAGLLSADQEFLIADHSTVLLNATFGIVAVMPAAVGGPVYPQATPGVSARLETEQLTLRGAIYDGDRIEEHGIPEELGEHALMIGEVESHGVKLGAWHHTALGNGYYGIVSRQVARRVGAFTRVSIARDQMIPLYIDCGIRFGPGGIWKKRKKDFISVGMAFAQSDLGAQTVAELTYQILVKGWLTVQPDVQVELKRDGTAGVIATRAVVAF
jgi:carbohydrate-selective porin OprB